MKLRRFWHDINNRGEKTREESMHFCFECNKGIPLLHSTWEGINSSRRIHWFVNYCPRCGTVTSVNESPFSYKNLVPRIGKLKSFLFVFLLIGAPYHLIACLVGGLAPGIGISAFVLLLSILASTRQLNEIDICPYAHGEQYPELVRKKCN